ncbi:hypothetical protein DES36_1221 [Alkalibaculum bacchi]|uniref:Uncharacterized protein n=1 Tax=Alkalibaculum bacchi TaxID=645887 RepID=A0A366HXT0_9FIRM|nr:hypothetical protein DES36_1221 [Alkalibaculum bacchi]
MKKAESGKWKVEKNKLADRRDEEKQDPSLRSRMTVVVIRGLF